MPPRRKHKRPDTPGYLRLQQFNFVRDLHLPAYLKGKESSYKALLFAIVSRLGKNNRCFPSLKTLARDAGLKSHTHVSTLLNDLESLGLIRRIPRTSRSGGRTSNEIEVLFPFDDPSQDLKRGLSSNEGHLSAGERGIPANENLLTNTNNKTINRTRREEEQLEVGVDPEGQHVLTTSLIQNTGEENPCLYEFPSIFSDKYADLEVDAADTDLTKSLMRCYLPPSIFGLNDSQPGLPPFSKTTSSDQRVQNAVEVIDKHIDWIMRGPGPRVSLWFELGRLIYPQSKYPKLLRFRSDYRLPHDQSTMLHAAFEANGHFAAPFLAMCISEWGDFIPQWEDKYPRLDLIWTHGQELITEYAQRLYTLLFAVGYSVDVVSGCPLENWITRDPLRKLFEAVCSGAIKCTGK